MHCADGIVRCPQYTYVMASLFETRLCKNGKTVWFNTGKHTEPRRSREKCLRDAAQWAAEIGVPHLPGYGSLHNKEFQPEKMPEVTCK